jgi:hypothetical protein
MEIIQIPEEHALVELSSIEIRALLKAWRRALDDMDEESVRGKFDMTRDGAWDLDRRLSEALDVAQHNSPDHSGKRR